MTTTNTMLAKLASLVAGAGLIAMSFAVMPAHAQTTTTNTQLQAQIQALLAQIAALQAQLGTSGGTTVSVTFTRDLTMGSRGADVTSLQTWLIGKGFSIPAGATGYFGSQTRAALAAFQAANGITPAAGYFGPITRGRIIAMIASAGNNGNGNNGTGNSGALQGGAGQLRNIDMLGDVESDLHEGDNATKVIGFSADANGSDIAVQRVDATLTIGGTSGSSNIDKYVDSVSLYEDGTKLATMDASAGDKDGRVWTFRFSDVNGVIREGKTANFYIEVTPVNSVGSAESGVTLTAALPTDSIRAVDAEGVSETYTPSGSRTQTFTVSTATTGTLTLNEASDNPRATVVKGDTNTETEDVTLLSFNLRSRNQDITVNNLPVTLTETGTTNVGDVVSSLSLKRGNTTLKTKSIPSGAGTTTTIVFDNLNDENIDSGSSQGYTVVANIRKLSNTTSGSAFDSGDTLTASVVGSNSNWDVEDANGNTVTPTGTVTGGTATFQTTGITVSLLNATANKTVGTTAGSGDTTQYAISFKVTAGDDDLYIARNVTNSATPSTSAVTWATTTSSNVGVTNAAASNLSASDTNGGDTASVYKIPAGSTRTFTLNVTLTASATGFTGVQLTGIAYGTTASLGSTYSAGLDIFKTQDVSMTTH